MKIPITVYEKLAPKDIIYWDSDKNKVAIHIIVNDKMLLNGFELTNIGSEKYLVYIL